MAGHQNTLVTFLCTDIEGSPALWERHPDAMSSVRLRHDAIVDALVGLFDGTVFESTGDRFIAAFERGRSALDAALAILSAMDRASWMDLGELRVRIALHTGEAELRDGDYAGQAVDSVARLLETAGGGQILVSEATAQMVDGNVPVGVSLRDIGEVRLPDIPDPIRVYLLDGRRAPGALATRLPERSAEREAGAARNGAGDHRGLGDDLAGRAVPAPTPGTLRVYTLGGFRIERDDQLIHPRGRRRLPGGQLFKCLVTRDTRRLVKDQAFALFFEKSGDAAENTIRSTLSRFREAVEPGVAARDSVIVYGHGVIAIRPGAQIWVDADAFEQLIDRARHAAEPGRLLEQADRLYGGDYLPDDPDEDWVVPRRQALRRRWMALQLDLAQERERRGDVDGAVAALQRLLAADPCNEHAARELMLLYARHGRTTEALRVFRDLIDALRKEFGSDAVRPGPDIEGVRRQILADEVPSPGRSGATPEAQSATAKVDPVRAPGSVRDLPLGHPLHPRRNSLPNEPTALVGRTTDVEAARDRLLSPGVRLLTLTGVGGSGKTRLARRVASDVMDEFADGVYFVDLGAIADHLRVIPSIAQALGVHESAQRSLAECVQDAIGEHEILLLLDNFEHVLEAARDVAALVAMCPRLKVMTTSRAALRISGEQIFEVGPLALPSLPPPTMSPSAVVADLVTSPAVQLFVERARDVHSDFAITEENAATVAEICRRLDGLPLAIELAAARIRMFSPPALLARLSRRLNLLTRGSRDMPARHQTMRDALAWSYDLLSPMEQVLFRRLAVFAGGCTVDAVEHVCRPVDGFDLSPLDIDPLDGLRSLVDSSLLQPVEHVDGEPRFRMLETVREFGLECLAATDALAALEYQHAAYYLAFAERAEAGLQGRQQESWQARLESEHDNLLAILGWTLKRGELGIGLRLAGSIWRSWGRQGYARDGRAWLETALQQSAMVEPEVRAKALVAAAELACSVGDIRRAMDRCKESLALCEATEDLTGTATSLHILAWCLAYSAQSEDDYHLAGKYQEQCLELQRKLGNRSGEAKALHELGEIARYLDDYATATARLEEALEMRRELGDLEGVGWSLHCLAWTHYDRHRYDPHHLDRAMQRAQEALAVWQELRHEHGIATTRSLRARIAWRQGDCARAASELRLSLPLWPKLQHFVSLGYDLEVLAGLAIACRPGRWGDLRAARLLAMAERLRDGAPVPRHRKKELDELEQEVRARLGAEAFEAARAKGRALPADRAAQQARTLAARWSRVEV